MCFRHPPHGGASYAFLNADAGGGGAGAGAGRLLLSNIDCPSVCHAFQGNSNICTISWSQFSVCSLFVCSNFHYVELLADETYSVNNRIAKIRCPPVASAFMNQVAGCMLFNKPNTAINDINCDISSVAGHKRNKSERKRMKYGPVKQISVFLRWMGVKITKYKCYEFFKKIIQFFKNNFDYWFTLSRIFLQFSKIILAFFKNNIELFFSQSGVRQEYSWTMHEYSWLWCFQEPDLIIFQEWG